MYIYIYIYIYISNYNFNIKSYTRCLVVSATAAGSILLLCAQLGLADAVTWQMNDEWIASSVATLHRLTSVLGYYLNMI